MIHGRLEVPFQPISLGMRRRTWGGAAQHQYHNSLLLPGTPAVSARPRRNQPALSEYQRGERSECAHVMQGTGTATQVFMPDPTVEGPTYYTSESWAQN